MKPGILRVVYGRKPIGPADRFVIKQGTEMASDGRTFFRLGMWIIAALAVPILPFLTFGEALEARFTSWLDTALPHGTVAMLVVGLLATDIFLPVPSSVVTTFSGKMLGFWGGMAASWFGMTVGTVVAFGLARAFGRPMAQRLAGADELERVDAMAARIGMFVLILARPIPILAEASVLLLGTTQLSWWRFLIAVGLSNLGIAAAYAALGDSVSLPVALMASVVLPFLVGGIARFLWPETGQQLPPVEPH